MKIDTHRTANLLGSIWMVAAMAIFAVEDAFVKGASITLPISEILIIFGVGGAVLFALLARVKGEALGNPDAFSKPMRVRVIFEIVGRLFYVLAIALIPLSAATVILQATPLVVVAGAAIIFGEKVGWGRWSAIIIGLLGVLIIIQPGTDSFSMLSILALIGMLGFAGRDLASRAAPQSLSANVLGFYGFASVVVAGVAYAIWEEEVFALPDTQTTFYLCGAIIAGVAAYSCLMTAMRTGEVSAVTPFRYTRLIFGIVLGVTLFGEDISSAMLVGSSLIVLSGLFILWQSKRAQKTN